MNWQQQSSGQVGPAFFGTMFCRNPSNPPSSKISRFSEPWSRLPREKALQRLYSCEFKCYMVWIHPVNSDKVFETLVHIQNLKEFHVLAFNFLNIFWSVNFERCWKPLFNFDCFHWNIFGNFKGKRKVNQKINCHGFPQMIVSGLNQNRPCRKYPIVPIRTLKAGKQRQTSSLPELYC